MNDGRVEVIDTRGSNHHQEMKRRGGERGRKEGRKEKQWKEK